MTFSPLPEPIEAFPIPADALVLSVLDAGLSERQLAVAALRQALTDRRLSLPLGPELAAEDPSRLLILNRFSLQLLCGGFASDQVSLPLAPLQQAGGAPQLLLAAQVDDENGVVWFPGVLTAEELEATGCLSRSPVVLADSAAEELELDVALFRGGIQRLLTLVQLLEPEALPHLRLQPAAAAPLVLRVREWLEGLLPPALTDLGGELVPLTATAFRGGAEFQASSFGITFGPIAGGGSGVARPLAILAIPLGLTTSGALVSGEASRSCVERFQLLLIPCLDRGPFGIDLATAIATSIGSGLGQPGVAERLALRLVGELSDDLIPDGLVLAAVQGSRRQSVTSAGSSLLELQLPADSAVIEVSITAPGGASLQLPPLQLPG